MSTSLKDRLKERNKLVAETLETFNKFVSYGKKSQESRSENPLFEMKLADLLRIEQTSAANMNISRSLMMARLYPNKQVKVDPKVQSAVTKQNEPQSMLDVMETKKPKENALRIKLAQVLAANI